MRGGNISASPAPRLLFVWEGLVGKLGDADAAKRLKRELKRERWANAVTCYWTDAAVAARLWHMYWSYDFALDLVTFHPEGFADALKERVDRERLPFGWVTASTPEQLAREVSWDRAVAAVYDGDARRQLLYGPKGRIVLDARVDDMLPWGQI